MVSCNQRGQFCYKVFMCKVLERIIASGQGLKGSVLRIMVKNGRGNVFGVSACN